MSEHLSIIDLHCISEGSYIAGEIIAVNLKVFFWVVVKGVRLDANTTADFGDVCKKGQVFDRN